MLKNCSCFWKRFVLKIVQKKPIHSTRSLRVLLATVHLPPWCLLNGPAHSDRACAKVQLFDARGRRTRPLRSAAHYNKRWPHAIGRSMLATDFFSFFCFAFLGGGTYPREQFTKMKNKRFVTMVLSLTLAATESPSCYLLGLRPLLRLAVCWCP